LGRGRGARGTAQGEEVVDPAEEHESQGEIDEDAPGQESKDEKSVEEKEERTGGGMGIKACVDDRKPLKEVERQQGKKRIAEKGTADNERHEEEGQREKRQGLAHTKGPKVATEAPRTVGRSVHGRPDEKVYGEDQDGVKTEDPEKIGVEGRQGLEGMLELMGFGGVTVGEERLFVLQGRPQRVLEKTQGMRNRESVDRKSDEQEKRREAHDQSQALAAAEKLRGEDEHETEKRKREDGHVGPAVGERQGEDQKGDDRRHEGRKAAAESALESYDHENRSGQKGEEAARVEECRDQTGEDRVIAKVSDEPTEHRGPVRTLRRT
jgi:hypothetical protein